MESKEGYCYTIRHFEGVIKDHTEIKEIILWSDGCGYQNRNATVANAYSELVRKHGVLVTQKYLVAGAHTNGV